MSNPNFVDQNIDRIRDTYTTTLDNPQKPWDYSPSRSVTPHKRTLDSIESWFKPEFGLRPLAIYVSDSPTSPRIETVLEQGCNATAALTTHRTGAVWPFGTAELKLSALLAPEFTTQYDLEDHRTGLPYPRLSFTPTTDIGSFRPAVMPSELRDPYISRERAVLKRVKIQPLIWSPRNPTLTTKIHQESNRIHVVITTRPLDQFIAEVQSSRREKFPRLYAATAQQIANLQRTLAEYSPDNRDNLDQTEQCMIDRVRGGTRNKS